MGATMVKVKVEATLPYRNGRFVPHRAGDVVELVKLTDSVARALATDS